MLSFCSIPHTSWDQIWLGIGLVAGVGIVHATQRLRSKRGGTATFEYAGRKVRVNNDGDHLSYEPTLITAPQDPRIAHLMRVMGAYQRLAPDLAPHLDVSDWAGHYELGSRNAGWTKFLAFLGVPEAAFETASTGVDLHWYSVSREALTFRHHIPAQDLDLRYTAKFDGEWRTSPYSRQTSTHWSEDEDKKKGFRWRNRWLKYPTSMRCEWENKGGGEVCGHGQPAGTEDGTTSITVMERHLVSPELINFRIFVYPIGADVDDRSRYLVPEAGVTYLKVSSELPLEPLVSV